MKTLLLLLVVGVVAFFVWKLLSRFKTPKCAALTFVNGGVKTGKTAFALHLAYKNYKASRRAWKIQCFFRKIFKKELPEEPLFYSNIPVAFNYVPLTQDHILRKVRFNYGSTVFVSEFSLLADKNLFKFLSSEELKSVSLFFKLFGHETKGGKFFSDSQALGDICIEFRRNIAQYFYVHHLEKHVPFLLFFRVREERYSEDNSVMSMYDEDTEDTLKTVLTTKRLWKLYDQYCYSVLTDNLPVDNSLVDGATLPDLKARYIVSFHDTKTNTKNMINWEELEGYIKEVKDD